MNRNKIKSEKRKKAVNDVDPSRLTTHDSRFTVFSRLTTHDSRFTVFTVFSRLTIHVSRFTVFLFAFFMLSVSAEATTSTIINTKHNLSVTGPGTIHSTSETRICVFCHTPHNAAPHTPLWNRALSAVTYDTYSSTTLTAPRPGQPTGPSRLCLSCHNGTIALGSVLQNLPSWGTLITSTSTSSYPGIPSSGTITMTGSITGASLIGGSGNLTGDHPFSFPYSASVSNPEIYSTPPSDLLFYNGSVDCTTCHDPHEDAFQSPDGNGFSTGKFLAVNNMNSALCTRCHNIAGWGSDSHSTSTVTIAAACGGCLPVSPRIWPTTTTWPTVADWGCENCHTMHNAGSTSWLLYYSTTEDICFPCHGGSGPQYTPPYHAEYAPQNEGPVSAAIQGPRPTARVGEGPTCYSCHDSPSISGPLFNGPHGYQSAAYALNAQPEPAPSVAKKSIYAEYQKLSRHSVEQAGKVHGRKESQRLVTRQATCTDCHDSHSISGRTAAAPYASGRLGKVSGVDINGVTVKSVRYEYEVCLKCHSDSVPIVPFSPGFPRPRVINSTNVRQQFNTLNASYHPVAGIGKNTSYVPSIPSLYAPGMTSSSIIYCIDCHESDDSSGIPGAGYSGPRGPHGSQYAPMIREEYLTADNTAESYQNYALCYRCHDRTTVLNQVGSSGSWTKHYSHIVTDSAPCSACHDPHGIYDTAPGTTGSHSRLINFDTSIVQPVSPNLVPLFNSSMPGSGSCTLLCHGHTHNHSLYP